MADAVGTNVIFSNKFHYILHMTNISDGTGETAVAKIDKSALVGPNGSEPTTISIENIRWDIQGFTEVRLLWDHTTDDLGMIMSASGFEDYTFKNHIHGIKGPIRGLDDPNSTGGTGDLVLTTTGATSGDTYDITIKVRLND